MRLLIRNAKILFDNEEVIKDIFIEYGEIVDIKDKIKDDIPQCIDAKENYLFPGLIDVNCNICDPGYEFMEDIESVSKAAIKGGFTSITSNPQTNPVIDNKTVVKYIENKSKKLALVNIFQYGSMTKNMNGIEISEIGEMKNAGIYAISDGGISLNDANLLNNIFKYSVMFDIPVITFCDDLNLSLKGVINDGFISTITGLRGIPRESEEIIVSRNIILAKHTKARLHISSVTTKESVEIIRKAKKDGINVTCDTCPHYFTLSEKNIETYDTVYKVKPPLRTKEDIEEIIKGLFDGTIDIISSGHSPTTIEQKNREFDIASYGISSLETAFVVSYDSLVRKRNMPLKMFLDKFTNNPVKLLNIKNKGVIDVGYDGDLFLFKTDAKTKIDATKFVSKAKFSPYENQSFYGKILFTVVNGNILYLKEI